MNLVLEKTCFLNRRRKDSEKSDGVLCIIVLFCKKNTGRRSDLQAYGRYYIDRYKNQARKPRSTPAATALPITPATFGPIACMSR